LFLYTLVALIYLLQRLSFTMRAETGARFLDAPRRGSLLGLVALALTPVVLFVGVHEARNYLVARSLAAQFETGQITYNSPPDLNGSLDAATECVTPGPYNAEYCAEAVPLASFQALRRETVAQQHLAVRAFLDRLQLTLRLDPYTAWVVGGQVADEARRASVERALQEREATLANLERAEQEAAAGGSFDQYSAGYLPYPSLAGEYDITCTYWSASYCHIRDMNYEYGPGFSADASFETWTQAELTYFFGLAAAVLFVLALALHFAITLRVVRLSENGTLYVVFSLYAPIVAMYACAAAAAVMYISRGYFLFDPPTDDYYAMSGRYGVLIVIPILAAAWIVPALAIGLIGPLRRERWGSYLARQAMIAMPGFVLAIITLIGALTLRPLIISDPQPETAIIATNIVVRSAIGVAVFTVATWFLWGWLDRRLIEANCRPRQRA
jgi:uncharacterized membrane protein